MYTYFDAKHPIVIQLKLFEKIIVTFSGVKLQYYDMWNQQQIGGTFGNFLINICIWISILFKFFISNMYQIEDVYSEKVKT